MPYPVAAVRGKKTGGGPGIVTLILDQFTDTNGTALASHTIAPTNTPATSWTVDVGTFDVTSNEGRCTAAVGFNAMAVVDAGVTDCTVTSKIKAGSSGGVLVRYQDATHYWRIGFSTFSNPDSFFITEYNAGNTTRASTTGVGNLSGSTFYTLSIVLLGTSITATLDGGNSITYSSSLFQAATKHGVHGDSAFTFDDFTITT